MIIRSWYEVNPIQYSQAILFRIWRKSWFPKEISIRIRKKYWPKFWGNPGHNSKGVLSSNGQEFFSGFGGFSKKIQIIFIKFRNNPDHNSEGSLSRFQRKFWLKFGMNPVQYSEVVLSRVRREYWPELGGNFIQDLKVTLTRIQREFKPECEENILGGYLLWQSWTVF